MTPPSALPKAKALLLAPEEPAFERGGGPLRAAMVRAYLEQRHEVTLATFSLKPHSNGVPARAIRNARRLIRGVPPLFDRFAGYGEQVAEFIGGSRYEVGVIEHFWCASYADLLRPRCDRLILDLHNIESQLARTHARVTRGAVSWASERFAASYEALERKWLPKFDTILVASEADRQRIHHRDVRVFPNAIPESFLKDVRADEKNIVAFSGNLAYHPNVEAVRWFHSHVWPGLRERVPGIEWHLIGRGEDAVRPIVSGDSSVRLTGAVSDAVSALSAAKVCMVPLLSGSGTRFKILEAWAASRAVVSTSIGAEGLAAKDGEHLMLADTPEAFLEAIVRLLHDPEERGRLGKCGRELLARSYVWAAAFRRLDEAGGFL